MKIINNTNHIQWIEEFVAIVLNNACIKYDKVIIDNIESTKQILISVDGQEYDIRTWSYYVFPYGDKNKPSAEEVEYTLYKIIKDECGSHSENVDKGLFRIE